jgi:uncharacterized Tic20 family protein
MANGKMEIKYSWTKRVFMILENILITLGVFLAIISIIGIALTLISIVWNFHMWGGLFLLSLFMITMGYACSGIQKEIL